MKKEGLSIVILAGGRAKRLGVDKSLINIRGKPLFVHTLDKVRSLSDDIIITTKTEKRRIKLREFEKDPIRIFADEKASIESPMIGALTGMKHAEHKLILLIGCDMPLIKPEVIELLYKYITGVRSLCRAVVPQFPNGYIEPLCAIYSKDPAIKALEQAINEESFKLECFIDLITAVHYIPIVELRAKDPELESFFNVNRRNDLIQFIKLLEEADGN